jgi:hypothetical protein
MLVLAGLAAAAATLAAPSAHAPQQQLLPPVYVHHINASVNDPRGYGYRRCGDINLAALAVNGEPVFRNLTVVEEYRDLTIKYYTEYKLERGSCHDAGFIFPPRSCVANPRAWCVSSTDPDCCTTNATEASDFPSKQIPWPFNAADGLAALKEVCFEQCRCYTDGSKGMPACTATHGVCAVCNPALAGNQVQTVDIHCEDVGCVFGDFCGDALYALCGAARNQSAVACAACVVKHKGGLNSDECFKDNDKDFCLATPVADGGYCTPRCYDNPATGEKICHPHCH